MPLTGNWTICCTSNLDMIASTPPGLFVGAVKCNVIVSPMLIPGFTVPGSSIVTESNRGMQALAPGADTVPIGHCAQLDWPNWLLYSIALHKVHFWMASRPSVVPFDPFGQGEGAVTPPANHKPHSKPETTRSTSASKLIGQAHDTKFKLITIDQLLSWLFSPIENACLLCKLQ